MELMSSKFVLPKASRSGEFDSKKHSQPLRLEIKPQVKAKL